MIAAHENGPRAGHTGPLGDHTVEATDFPTTEQQHKQEVTQIAKLALAGHAVHKGQSGDYLVCKYGMSRYCQDFLELQAFARKLGVSK